MIREHTPGVWEIDGRLVGVAHELRQDGDHLIVRDVRVNDRDGIETHAEERRVPITTAVHALLNATDEELRLLGQERTSRPG